MNDLDLHPWKVNKGIRSAREIQLTLSNHKCSFCGQDAHQLQITNNISYACCRVCTHVLKKTPKQWTIEEQSHYLATVRALWDRERKDHKSKQSQGYLGPLHLSGYPQEFREPIKGAGLKSGYSFSTEGKAKTTLQKKLAEKRLAQREKDGL